MFYYLVAEAWWYVSDVYLALLTSGQAVNVRTLLGTKNFSSSYAFRIWGHPHKLGLGPTVRGMEANVLLLCKLHSLPCDRRPQ